MALDPQKIAEILGAEIVGPVGLPPNEIAEAVVKAIDEEIADQMDGDWRRPEVGAIKSDDAIRDAMRRQEAEWMPMTEMAFPLRTPIE